MKRIFAFVLCLTMLLSQMAMVAEASRAKSSVDLQYLQDSGIDIEGGGQVIVDGVPLGRSDAGDKYAPSVPKFMPETMRNLALVSEKEESTPEVRSASYYEAMDWVTYTATFNKDKVMFYAYAGNDAESIYVDGLLGEETELIYTADPMWYQLDNSYQAGYTYVKAEDVGLVDKLFYRGAMLSDSDVSIYIEDAPNFSTMRRMPVDEKSIPRYRFKSDDTGVRTLLGTYSLGIRTRDGEEWSASEPVEVRITYNELPELSPVGRYYVEGVRRDGTVEVIPAMRCWMSNMIIFNTDEFTTLSVYTLDYPEDTVKAFPAIGDFDAFSAIYGRMNLKRPFEDVVDIQFENPDSMKVTPFYNETLGRQDWQIEGIGDNFVTEKITIYYKEPEKKPDQRYTDEPSTDPSGIVYYYRNTDLNTLAANRNYNLDASCSTDGLTTNGTNRIRLGKLNTAGPVVLTMNGGINCDAAGDSLYMLVNTGANGVFRRGASRTSYLVSNQAGGTYGAYGGGTKYLNIDGNHVASTQAMMYFNSTKTQEICDVYLIKGWSSGGGGAIVMKGGTLKLEKAYIDDCRGAYGGGIYQEAGTINIVTADYEIKNCQATSSHGGGIYITGGTINFKHQTTFTSNKAAKSGGAICTNPEEGTTCTVNFDVRCQFYNNSANNGGAIYNISRGKIVVDKGISLRKNSATDRGGAIFNEGTFTVSGTDKLYVGSWTVASDNMGNSAKNGAGIYQSGGTFSIAPEVAMGHNIASENGGAIYVNGGTLKLNGGGNIGTYVYSEKTVSGNQAKDGAGIYVNGGTLTFGKAINIKSNKASSEGGGIYYANGTRALAHAHAIESNSAADGGGIYLAGGATLTISAAIDFKKNEASSHGGGMYIHNGTLTTTAEVDIGTSGAGNKAKWGAGIYVKNGTINGNALLVIRYNTASENGGGLMVEQGTLTISGEKPMNVGYNTATNGYGGGVNLYDGGNLVDDTTGAIQVYANSAKTNGGGISLDKNSSITSNGGITVGLAKNGDTVRGNTAKVGAGIYLGNRDNTASTFTNSGEMVVQYNYTTSEGDGGGMYLAAGKFTTSAKVTIKENEAHEGGGLFLNGGTFESTGSALIHITGNNGEGNAACHHGGGIHAEKGTITINSSDHFCVFRNYGQFGAGLFFGQSGGKVTIDGTGTGNFWPHENFDTEADGAAIWIEACTVELKHNTFVNRQAYGAADAPGTNGSGNTKGAMKIQELGSSGVDGILNVYAKLTIEKCEGGDWPGGIHITTGGELNVQSGGTVDIYGCKTTGNGGAIRNGGGIITNAGTITIGKSGNANTASGNGGGIAQGSGSITSSGTMSVSYNTASGSGGGILLEGGSLTSTGKLNVTYNTAGSLGGGIYAANTTLSITGSGSTISNNKNTGTQGGGLYANKVVLTLTGVTVDSNTTDKGHSGGMIILGESGKESTYPATLTNCHITNNTCQNTDNSNSGDDDRGAGIYAQHILISISGGSIKNNVTKYGRGGGIYYNSSQVLTITNGCEISGNQALKNGSTTADRGNGGGIYVDNGSLDINGCTISGNKGDLNGGGIFTKKNVTLSGTKVNSNSTVSGSGGGIYMTGGSSQIKSSSQVNSNVSGAHGGGIFMTAGSITVDASTIDSNSSASNGAGLCMDGTSIGTVTLQNKASISNNKTTGTGKRGGGVWMSSGTLNVKSQSTIYKNHATQYGGGIYMNASGTVTVNTASVANNTSGDNGCGICMNGSGTKTLNLQSGAAVTGNVSSGAQGGGLWVNTDSTVNISGSTEISSNQVSGVGGGIYLTGGKINISGTNNNITGNSASTKGGGLYLNTGTVTNTGTLTVSSNTSGTDGAGIYQHDVTFNTSGTLSVGSNIASGSGGGIYLAGGTFNNTGILTVGGNVATANGGGIYTLINLTLGSTSSVTNNKAGSDAAGGNGGGVYVAGGTVTVNSTNTTTINKNEAVAKKATASSGGFGGGIYVKSGAGLTLTAGTISENKATIADNQNLAQTALGGGIYAAGTVTVNGNFTISKNQTSRYGGGLYVAGGNVTISGGRLTIGGASTSDANSAKQRGGGIVVNTGTLTNSSELVVMYNTAVNGGGGVCMDNAGTFTGAGILQISNNSATGTNATDSFGGGGVCIYHSSANFTASGATGIYENTSATNGGGVYLSAGNFKPATVSGSNFNIRHNQAVNGAGLYYTGGTFAPTGTTQFYSNTANGLGGGIYTTATWTMGSNVAVGISTNDFNKAKDGGGVYVNGGTLTVNGCNVYYNQATQNGGGVYVNSGTVTVSAASHIKVNTAATNGGGLYVANGTVNYNADSRVDSNTATNGSGGGIYMNGGTINAVGARLWLEKNKAPKGNGGAIYIAASGATLETKAHATDTTKKGAITVTTGNTAISGGGIYMAAGNIKLGGGTGSFIGGYANVGTGNIATGTADGQGGGGAYIAGGTFSVTGAGGLQVGANEANRGGGFYISNGTLSYTSSGKLEVGAFKYGTNANITPANKAGHGGGIYVAGGTVTLSNAIFDGNFATQGGGAYILSGKLELNTGSTMKNHVYRKDGTTEIQYGAGVYMAAGEFILDNSSITDNKTGSNACGICMNGSTSMTVTLKNGASVTNNIANGSAGGIWVNGYSTLNLEGNVTISGNKANNGNGGGIYFNSNGGIVNVSGTGNVIKGNTATSNGGGIYLNGDSATDDKIVIASGGALTVGGTAAADQNTAVNGGGIYMANGTLTNSGAVAINYNTATEKGGGIYLANGAVTNASGKTLNVNSNKTNSGGYGGGIYMADGTITNNGTMTSDSNVSGAAQSGYGGGLYLASGTFKTVGNLSISTNQAYKGAGVFLAGGIFETAGTSKNNTYYIGNNKGVGTTAASHGAGFFAQSGTIRVNSAANLCVYRNFANYGPGIFFGQNGGTITIDGTGGGYLWVHENHDTSADGSAIWIESCTVNLSHELFMNRQVHGAADEKGKNGNTKGAIRIQKYSGNAAKGILNVCEGGLVRIENCTGSDWSGGITMIANSELNVQAKGAVTITGCSTTGDGGAIHNNGGIITNAGTMTIGKANTTDKTNANSAGNNGGGIYVTASTGSLTNTGTLTVSYNTATNSGGGIQLSNSCTMNSTGKLNVENNTANAGHGGGINADTIATFSVTGTGSTISGNKAKVWGGGMRANATTVTLSNCTVNGNTANTGHGGGIFLFGNSSNTATYSATLTNCAVTNNACGNTDNVFTGDDDHGAGIYAEHVILTVNGGSVTGNSTAYGRGGGIYFNSSGQTLTFNKDGSATCEISGNKAKRGSSTANSGNGGGVYIGLGNVEINKAVNFYSNQADYCGGGLYVTGGNLVVKSGGTLTIGANTKSNTAGYGAGLFVNEGTQAIKGAGKLQLSYNTATTNGGGMQVENATVTISETLAVEINNNKATNGYGGGIVVNSSKSDGTRGSLAETTGGSFLVRNNVAGTYGGGLYTDGTFTSNGSISFYSNTANDGGGIYCDVGHVSSIITLSGGDVYSNIANKDGGGIYVKNGTFTNNGTLNVYSNTAATDGGGIYLNSGNVTLGTVSVYTNKATAGAGGGIYTKINLGLNGITVGGTTSDKGNEAKTYGGGVYVASGTLTLTAASILYNYAKTDGGGIYLESGAITVAAGTTKVNLNKADSHGGGIHTKTGALTVNGTLQIGESGYANTARWGAGIYVGGTGSTATFAGSGTLNVTYNEAGDNGGGIQIEKVTLAISDPLVVYVYSNTAKSGYGGGLNLYDNGHLTLNSTKAFNIYKNKAGTDGGGISVKGTSTFTVASGTIVNVGAGSNANTAANGGGIYLAGANSVVTNSGTLNVQYNEASTDGGGIYVASGTFNCNGTASAIQSNKATGNGGGVYAAGGKLNFTIRAQINSNSAANGGGIYNNAGTINVTSTGITLTNNTASANGGGIYNKSTFSASGNDFWVGSASKEGDNRGNKAVDGAGIYQEAGTFTIKNKALKAGDNRASRNGGGMYIAGGKMILNTGTFHIGGEFDYNGYTIAGNKATERGAGIYMTGGTLEHTGGTLNMKSNHAGIDGGGIWISGGTATFTGATIANNRANYGGGAYMMSSTSPGTLNLTGGTVITGHTVKVDGTTPIESGAGVYMWAGTLSLSGASKIENNQCGSGAGVYMNDGTVNLSDTSLIQTNTATGSGGGVYMSGGTLNLDGTSAIQSNNTGNTGGGVYMSGGKVTMTGGSLIQSNTSTQSGAGVLMAGGTLNMSGNSKIQSNNSGKYGGGIYMTTGTITMENAAVHGNISADNACGICMNESGAKILNLKNGAAITNNIAGATSGKPGTAGGLWAGTNSTVNISGTVTISGNQAKNGDGGGLYVTGATINATGTTKIFSNSASKNGGGVHMAGAGTVSGEGAFQIYSNTAVDGAGMYLSGADCTFAPTGTVQIYSNTASDEGGGIYSNKTWTLKGNIKVGCTVDGSNLGNSAKNGGGIYVAGGTLTTSTGTVAVKYNTASSNGGGIYLASGEVSVTSHMDVDGNTAGYGGGIYVNSGLFNAYGPGVYVLNNTATRGAGVYMHDGTLKWQTNGSNQGGWRIYDNSTTTGGKGGGVFINKGSVVSASTSEMNIYGNTAGYGGGIYVGGKTGDADKDIRVVTFSGDGNGLDIYNNTATRNGGGIMAEVCDLTLGIPACLSHNKATNSENNSCGYGGGIYLGGWSVGGTITVSKTMNVYGNTAFTNGGGIYVASGASDTVIIGMTISSGATVNVKSGVTIDQEGGTFTAAGNSAKNGGGIFVASGYLTNNGTLNVASNQATNGSGGGIYIAANVSFSSTKTLTVNSNSATGHGGGMYVDKATTFSITGTGNTINSNAAGSQGGAIRATDTANMVISDCTVSGNTVNTGHAGGIFVYRYDTYETACSLTLTNCDIIGNECKNTDGITKSDGTVADDDRGAGIYDERYALSISGGSVKNNKTPYGRGGGIYVHNTGASLTVSNCEISGNEAGKKTSTEADRGRGGGIYSTVAVTLTNVTLGTSSAPNKADNEGGGIYCDAAVTVTLSGTTSVGYNTAGSDGGGIYKKNGTLTMQNKAAIQHNVSGKHGGGVYMSNATLSLSGTTAIHHNTATQNGGGIHYVSGTISIASGATPTIHTNSAANGGGIFAAGNLSVNGALTIGGTNTTGNTVTGHGGGIYANGTLTLTGVTVKYNQATGGGSRGGGIYALQNTTLSGVTVNNNSAGQHGGGIYCDQNVEVVLKGTTTVGYNTATGNGGGVYKSSGTLKLENTITVNNNSAANGGGIYMNSGNFNNTGTLNAHTNTATTSGGGIYFNSGSATCGTLNVYSNTATGGSGGGIYTKISLTMVGATIGGNAATKGNTAGANGGGVYLDGSANLTLSGKCQITYNKATGGNGGGVYINSGTFKSDSGAANSGINNNNAPAGNGGGVYVNTGKADFTGKCFISDNGAANGAGIYNHGGTVEFNTHMSMGGNSATENGGGIYNNATFKVNTGSLWLGSWHTETKNTGNTAKNGGGIYQNGGTFTFGGASKSVNLRMADNRASKNGGAIYVKGGNLNFSASTGENYYIGGLYYNADLPVVAGNKAGVNKDGTASGITDGGNGGGIYQEGGTITVACSSTLGLRMGDNVATANGGALCLVGGSMSLGSGNHYFGSYSASANNTIYSYAGNEAANGAGIYLASGGSLDVSGSGDIFFGDNKASGNGGGIYTEKDLTLTNKVKVGYDRTDGTTALKLGNYAVDGAGIYVAGKILTLNGVQVKYNMASQNGGGIYMNGGKLLTSGNSIGNVTANYAGVTRNTDGTVAGVANGKESGLGGGICLWGSASMTMNGGELSGNYAYATTDTSKSTSGFGGGLYVGGSASASLGGGKVTNNQVIVASGRSQTALGGGIYTAGTLTFTGNVEISGNKATRYGGGLLQSGGTINVNANVTVDVKENNAPNGAGISSGGGTINVNGLLEVHHNSGNNGAGVGLDGKPLVQGSGTLNVHDNTATGNGGGIWMVTYSATTDESNRLKMSGTVLITNNQAKNGGGIFISSGNVELNNKAKIEGNTATESGGGIHMNTSDINETTTTHGKVTLTGSKVNSNKAKNGGGVYMTDGELKLLSGASITNHTVRSDGTTAILNGGGIYMKNGTVTLDGASEISGNTVSRPSGTTADGNGGGIHMTVGTLNVLGGSKITKNNASFGGGICGGGTVNVTNSFITENFAGGTGGGIFVSGSTVTLNGTSEIRGNRSGGGGGVRITSGSIELKDTSKIIGNTSTSTSSYDGGGGIYMGGGTVKLTGSSSITGNTAANYGGGIDCLKGTVTFSGTPTISGNSAGTNGGGIYQRNSDTSITVSSGATLTVGSDNAANSAANGGGLYLDSGVFTVSGALKVDSNTATTNGGGIYTKVNLTLGSSCTVTNNKAGTDANIGGNGGGIYLEANTLTLNGGTISSNTANVKTGSEASTGFGGGLYQQAGTVTISGNTALTFTGNNAYRGAAIAAMGGTLTANSSLKISANPANQDGGGIQVQGGTVTLTGSTVEGNSARWGGGIYLRSGKLTLTGGAVIQNNGATVNGGGLYYVGGTFTLPTAESDRVKICGNTATSYGGGIFAAANMTLNGYLTVGGASLKDGNYANAGGGIYIDTNKTLTVSGSVNVSNNAAKGNGGGIYANGGAVSVTGCSINNNYAGVTKTGTDTVMPSSAGGNGGGIFMTGSAQKLTLNGVELKNNVARMAPAKRANEEIESATGRGGAVAVENCDLVLTGATVIEGNRADHNGGGVHVFRTDSTASPTVKATMTGTSSKHISIKNNQAGYQGGGAYIYGAHLDANYVDVTDNQAADMGGGLLLVSYDKKNGANTGLTLSAMQAKFQNGKITGNTSGDSAGGIYIEGYQNTASVIRATTITDNTADKNGGGIYLRYTKMVLDGANTVTRNTAKAVGENSGKGGGIMVHNGSSLTVTGVTKSPIYANTAEVAGNDIFAVGATDDQLNTTLVMPETTANGAPEYWYADYFANDSKYPGQDTFPSAYKDANGKYIHLGRYNEKTTPVTYARRSFGGTSTETGAAEASTAYLALTLSTKVAYMNLTLTKVLKDANGKVETAVENTTFIFYVRGVDNAEYRLPVVIHLDKGASTGAVTINNLPLGIYDICEDESWSWRYEPSTATATGTVSATFHDVADGDDFIRVTAEAGTTSAVSYTNGIENVLWLSDAEYLPFLAPVQTRSLKDGDDENEEETE